MVPIEHVLIFSAILFCIGMYGVMARRNGVLVLMAIELMLNAVAVNLVAFSSRVDPVGASGIVFAIFVITYPISQEIELLMRSWGMAPPRLERLLPWLGDNVLASFLVYFVLYDFAAYWLHRAQHAIPWWWALHSLHHSQRRMTVWSDDRTTCSTT